MSSLFERRELTREIVIPSKHLQRNIQSSFLSQIKADVEGRCGIEGYVVPKSSLVIGYSLGALDLLKPGIRYLVKFQADICFPHKGQILKVPATFKSKIGVHGETSPLRVLLPRDLHIGNTEFENIQEGDEIEFEVLGSEFKQGDESIFVLGKLVSRTPSIPPPSAPETLPIPETAPASAEETTKSVTFVAPSVEEKKEPTRRKRRLGTGASLQLNVEPVTGAEGTSGST